MQQGSNATATLTDEQILDMEPEAVAQQTRTSDASAAGSDGGTEPPPSASDNDALAAAAVDAARATDNLRANGTAQSSAVSAPGDPPWLVALDAQPEAAAEARRWRDAAKDVSALDAAYFSSEPGARSGLAVRLYQSDAAAFRAMLAEGARALAARDPQGLAELARQLGAPETPAAPEPARSLSQAARPASQDDAARAPLTEASRTNTVAASSAEGPSPANGAAFPAESYRAFESATNEDVGRRMHEAIDRTLGSTLPEGLAEGARRRIGEDVFREVHASLASDRELARRVGETLRDWRFDAAARQQVVALVSGRARAVLPEVARRVVAEWTSSVLASDRAKTARIDAAASRRDITGGRLPEPVPASALRPREVDYRRLSDEQILEM
jgi:hypothetical protein